MAKEKNPTILKLDNLRNELSYYSDIYIRDIAEGEKLAIGSNRKYAQSSSAKLGLMYLNQESDRLQSILKASEINITSLTKNISLNAIQEKTVKEYLNNFSEFVYPEDELVNKELTGLLSLSNDDF